jgi:ribonuclease G
MSKELVVSSNRHETRVAVLEDDQVVEVFHQREKEYSLAGSIHKGRVTRVLPGMQSAFVDIGLDRDAFLYVSDFFEDNEEYDKIVTSVEEKVLKMDKGIAGPQVAPAATVAPPATPPAPEPVAEVSAAPPAPASAPVAAPPFARRNEERDRDRRGRRSRRRRPGGRGLPDSKYSSPAPRVEAAPPPPQPPPEAAVEAEADEEMMVLPGESLAKYSQPGEPVQEPRSDQEAWSRPEEQSRGEQRSRDEERSRGREVAVFAEPAEAEVSAEPLAAAPIVDRPEERPAAANVFETSGAPFAEAPAPPEPEPQLSAVSETVSEVAAAEEGIVESFPEEVAAETAGTPEVSEKLEPYPAEPVDEGPAEEALGPEPARIPTSLTAALREQGPRFQHRISRRMRRRGRGEGAPDFQQRGEPARESRPQESRPDQRAASRPETARPEAARPDRSAAPSISDLLREGQEIIVQIAKEPLGQKGARITSHIALPGRFLVYMPTVEHIGVSRKIPSDDERLRLKRILQSNRAGIPGGYIVRTAGEGHTEEELRADMMFLYNLWLDLRQKAEKRPAPALIHHDLDVVERILRDQLTSSFKNVWVDNEEVYENVLRFVQRFQPALVGRVKLYTRSTPIFDEFNITQELEKALRPKVWLKTGGHIVINQTEALVAIDVNTGKFVGKSNRLEDTIVKTNTDAIKEIVRQIRLRDLGGIIVVDFIDMDERKNRQKVMQTLEEAMRADRAPYKILQFNDFGLVAITRKRVKQSLERTLCVPCPYCEGSGYVKSVQTVIGEILQEAQKIARAVEGNDVTLRVHPEVAKVLKSSHNSYLQELEEILGRTVLVKSDPLLHQEKFDLA